MLLGCIVLGSFLRLFCERLVVYLLEREAFCEALSFLRSYNGLVERQVVIRMAQLQLSVESPTVGAIYVQ